MENIQPLSIWLNGITQIAEKIDIFINFDNLQTNAILGYKLYNKEEIVITENVVIVSGDNYKNWDGSNIQAYEIVGSILNIVYIK